MGNAMPVVSVIMGVYNQRDRAGLRNAVRSILNQTFTDFEFIIYNDGSDEETTKFIEETEKFDNRIRVVGKDENMGLGFSLNQCIKLAKGRYIARMDADDVSMPRRLERQISFLEANPDIYWCGCNAHLFDAKGPWGEREMPEYPTPEDYLKYSPYIHPTVVFKREVLEESKGYSEEQDTLLCEDYEMFMRLEYMGFSGANLQEKLFAYREDQKSFGRRSFKRRLNETRTRYRNFRKLGLLFPGGWIYVLRPLISALIPTKVIRILKRKEDEVNGRERETSFGIPKKLKPVQEPPVET